MPLYRYVKRQPGESSLIRKNSRRKHKKVALVFVGIGLVFLISAAYPIISYQILMSPKFTNSFISPTAEAEAAQNFGMTAPKLGQEIDLIDYTKAANWFPGSDSKFVVSEEKFYKLSIPKLGIEDADVAVGGEDLKKSLIQFPGTIVPGKYGNTVIFGHSVLPQFFNPKNYMTIFSTLPSLKPKDEITIDYNQMKYKYIVERMIEVTSDDISILAQRYDDSYLTLITCVPPGTYFKRLIVRARLSKL